MTMSTAVPEEYVTLMRDMENAKSEADSDSEENYYDYKHVSRKNRLTMMLTEPQTVKQKRKRNCVSKSIYPWAYRGLIFPTGTTISRYLWLPVNEDSPEMQPHYAEEDIDVKEWFPRGHCCTNIRRIAGTSAQLKNQYTMYISADHTSSMANIAVAEELGRYWPGNIIVLKTAKKHIKKLVNVGNQDRRIIRAMVAAWIDEFYRCTEMRNTSHN